jgi:uncharacterized lipoprotein YbaY
MGVTKTVSVKAGESKTIDNLQPGEYSVTESRDGAEIANYTLADVEGEGVFEIKAGETKSVTIKNTYEKTTAFKGSIVISKTIALPDGADLSEIGNIVFTISPKIGNTSKITLDPDNPGKGWKASGNTFTYEFKNLNQGKEYTITETSNGSNDTYKVAVTPDTVCKVTTLTNETEDTSVSAVFTNTYTKKQTTNFKGTLEISKTISLPDGVNLSEIGNIVFTISPKIGNTD